MNNSKIALDSIEPEQTDPKDSLRERESFLVRVIEAIGRVEGSADWKVLQKEIFDPLTENLQRLVIQETRKEKINTDVIHSLNGQLAWAKKYSKLDDLSKIFKVELTNIRKQING